MKEHPNTNFVVMFAWLFLRTSFCCLAVLSKKKYDHYYNEQFDVRTSNWVCSQNSIKNPFHFSSSTPKCSRKLHWPPHPTFPWRHLWHTRDPLTEIQYLKMGNLYLPNQKIKIEIHSQICHHMFYLPNPSSNSPVSTIQCFYMIMIVHTVL